MYDFNFHNPEVTGSPLLSNYKPLKINHLFFYFFKQLLTGQRAQVSDFMTTKN